MTGLFSAAPPAPPANPDLETALLGALLTKPALYDGVAHLIGPDDFIAPAHQRIYAAIRTLAERGEPATPGTLKLHFDRDETLSAIGGARYLVELAAAALNLHDAPHFARAIRDLAERRRAIDLLQEAVADLYAADIDTSAAGIVETMMARLDGGGRGGDMQAVALPEALDEALREAEDARRTGRHLCGVPTGYAALDDMLGGMGGGEMIVLAGRPSMGKSALAGGIAQRAAAAGVPTAFFTQEMSRQALARRWLAGGSGVPATAIKRGRYGAAQAEALVRARGDLAGLPIHIVHRPSLTPSQLRLEARRLQRLYGIGLVIVDHLTIMRGDERRYASRTAEITDITAGIKATAVALDVPVLALCQLNRGVEGRDDKRPQLSDLRDSGSIEQDADAVLFLYRHAYYLARAKPAIKPGEDPSAYSKRLLDWQTEMDRCEHVADVIAAKVRDGEIGTAQLYWDGGRTLFGDLDTHHHAPEAPF